MNRPSFQFYPDDWQKNAKLRRCSHAARGAWMDVLCLLHDADEYGLLRWPLNEIAHAAAAPLKLLRELADKGVLKGSDKGCAAFTFRPNHGGRLGEPITLIEETTEPAWYCSRFVRDEYVRQKRGSATRFDSDNQPPKEEPKPKPKTTPKPPIGGRQGDGASSSSSASKDQDPKIPAGKQRAARVAIKTWLASIGDADAIAPDDPIFDYAEKVGIPEDFLRLSWKRFVEDMSDRGTLKANWRAHYRNAVKGNWFKLWWFPSEGECRLTTTGEQARRAA